MSGREGRPAANRISADHISDDYMNERLGEARPYTLIVLRPTVGYSAAGSRTIIWEHGRRNMALQAAGIMPIVCPVGDDQISGIGICSTGPDETRAIMAGDPAVRAGIFTCEIHPCTGFPGDSLPL